MRISEFDSVLIWTTNDLQTSSVVPRAELCHALNIELKYQATVRSFDPSVCTSTDLSKALYRAVPQRRLY